MQAQQIDREQAYKSETNAKVKERMSFIMLVKVDGRIPAHAAKELHRVKLIVEPSKASVIDH